MSVRSPGPSLMTYTLLGRGEGGNFASFPSTTGFVVSAGRRSSSVPAERNRPSSSAWRCASGCPGGPLRRLRCSAAAVLPDLSQDRLLDHKGAGEPVERRGDDAVLDLGQGIGHTGAVRTFQRSGVSLVPVDGAAKPVTGFTAPSTDVLLLDVEPVPVELTLGANADGLRNTDVKTCTVGRASLPGTTACSPKSTTTCRADHVGRHTPRWPTSPGALDCLRTQVVEDAETGHPQQDHSRR